MINHDLSDKIKAGNFKRATFSAVCYFTGIKARSSSVDAFSEGL